MSAPPLLRLTAVEKNAAVDGIMALLRQMPKLGQHRAVWTLTLSRSHAVNQALARRVEHFATQHTHPGGERLAAAERRAFHQLAERIRRADEGM